MKLEAGKSYKAKSGEKITLLGKIPTPGVFFPWSGYAAGGIPSYWSDSGQFTTGPHHWDLVAEWEDPKPRMLAFIAPGGRLCFYPETTVATLGMSDKWIKAPWLDEPEVR